MTDSIELPPAADFHVHLRDGPMMETVVPSIRMGGASLVYVMPNLSPPITTVQQALDYHSRLTKLDSNVTYMMTLYLTPELTPETISAAAKTGIIHGVKSYPKGLTTNSEHGVLDYTSFYPLFRAMESHDLVLNIHGESPSDPTTNTTILTAESHFLPTLTTLHAEFPNLRIVLEHCTTEVAIKTVLSLGPSVAATITAHHLYLTIDEWSDNPHCYCKPVAKLPSDRAALIKAATSGNPKFFLGTDSAPHEAHKKEASRTAAGVFTQPYAIPLVAEIFAREKALDKLKGFVCDFGREFYKVVEKNIEPTHEASIILSPEPERRVIASILRQGGTGDDNEKTVKVIPFRAGERVWNLEWAAKK